MFSCIKCGGFFSYEDMAKEGKRLPCYCKSCRNTMRNTRYAKDPEHYRQYHRDYGKISRLLNSDNYRKRDLERYEKDKLTKPETIKARNRVHDDFRSANKKLKKQPCEVCGVAAQAHHEDYSKPLEIKWLCPVHHTQRHKELMEVETSS